MGDPRAGALAALTGTAARAGYAALFTAALPVLLVAWGRAADRFLALPAVDSPAVGWPIAAGGTLLMSWAWTALVRDGGGLPMNAFPPPRFVETGPYRFIAHPIYVGFCSAVFGCAIAVGSPSGLWIVGPVVALGCAALVLGYEAADLHRRFGPNQFFRQHKDRGESAPAASGNRYRPHR